MALKSDLTSSFKDNLSSKGSISNIAKLITDDYKKSVDIGTDVIGNKWQGINYDIIESAIESQFQLSFNTRRYLEFNLIENGLVQAWSSATLKLPAIPARGMSTVDTGIVSVSTPPNTPPLYTYSRGYENIVNSFFNAFTNHAKTIIFLYNGSSTGRNPSSIGVSVKSFLIK